MCLGENNGKTPERKGGFLHEGELVARAAGAHRLVWPTSNWPAGRLQLRSIISCTWNRIRILIVSQRVSPPYYPLMAGRIPGQFTQSRSTEASLLDVRFQDQAVLDRGRLDLIAHCRRTHDLACLQ